MTDLKDTETFFNFLGGADEIFAASFLHKDAKQGQIPGMGTIMAKSASLINTYKALNGNDASPTLHVTLNQTSPQGRKLQDVQAPRVLCVDLDTPVDRAQIKDYVANYRPHMVVETSEGKYHIYWKVVSTIPLEHWAKYQLALNNYFNGDLNLDVLNHTIRVPGIERTTKDGGTFTPKIVYYVDNAEPLSEPDVGAYFPWINAEYRKAKLKKEDERRKIREAYKKGKPLSPGIAGRNNTLYNLTKEFVACVHTNEDGTFASAPTIEDALEYAKEINQSFSSDVKGPLSDSEVITVIKSAYARGIGLYDYRIQKLCKPSGIVSPEYIVPKVTVSADQLTDYQPYEYDYEENFLKANRFTDYAHVARILQRFGEKLLIAGDVFYAYNEEQKLWRKQASNTHGEIFSFIKTCALDIINDPFFIRYMATNSDGAVSDSKRRKAEERFLSLRMYSTTVKALLNSPEIKRVSTDVFDAKPNVVYCSNSAVDLVSGNSRGVQATDYLLNRTNIPWIPGATCPFFEEFIREVFSENVSPDEMYRFIQELFGYSLSGSIHEQKIFCHYGDGSNGKSKVLYALSLIANDYARFVSPDDLVTGKGSYAKAFERFGIKTEGKRVIIVDDIDVETIWNESFVKNITGPVITARALYQEARTFANRAKVHLGLNVAPKPQAENYGILRRLCLIPYPKRFTVDPQMSELIDSNIHNEAPGILQWSAEGLRRVINRGGILYPEELTVAIEEYKSTHFKFETLLEDLFEYSPELNTADWEFATELISDTEKYLASSGTPGKITTKEFTDAIRRKWGLDSTKKWCNKRKNSFTAYPLKPKFERVDALQYI